MQLNNGNSSLHHRKARKVVYATHGKIAAGVEKLCMPFKMHKEQGQYA
jgi:hypothetical protein